MYGSIDEIMQSSSALSSTSGINFNFHNALRQSHIVLENDIPIYHEPIDGSDSYYTRLRLVLPSKFYNILFVAFHSNPMDGHFNVYLTRLSHPSQDKIILG